MTSSRPFKAASAHSWTIELWDLLADGEWHYEVEVVAKACVFVPPGHAFRRLNTTADPVPTPARIARGQRLRMLDAVYGLLRTGRLERRNGPYGHELRRTPTT